MRVYLSFDTGGKVVGEQRYHVATLPEIPRVGEYVLLDDGTDRDNTHKVEVVTHVVHLVPDHAHAPDAYVVLRGRNIY